MKIVAVSDNHGKICLDTILLTNPDADVFIHCGDSEFPPSYLEGYAAVCGNNDYFDSIPMELILNLGKHRALVVHGHRFSMFNLKKALTKKAIENQCDLVFYGHTHRFSIDQIEGVTLINPGSLRYNRDNSDPCYAIVEITDEKITVNRVDL